MTRKVSTTGKQFEKVFREQASNLKDVYVYRLVDQMNFMKGSTNPCDFFCFKKPNFYLIECKTTEVPSLPRKNISDGQLHDMYEAVKTKGVKAYVVVWYYKKDICRAFPIEYVWKQFMVEGKKSINYQDEHGILITGTKKKKYFDWNWQDLFNKK